MQKILRNLTFWVLTAIVCGILLGHFYPDFALKPILDKGIKFNLYLSEFELKTSFSELLSSFFYQFGKTIYQSNHFSYYYFGYDFHG